MRQIRTIIKEFSPIDTPGLLATYHNFTWAKGTVLEVINEDVNSFTVRALPNGKILSTLKIDIESKTEA